MDTSPPPPPATSAPAPAPDDKTIALLAYLTIVGFIIAIVMHNSKKTKLGAFHLRQALGLFLTGFVCAFVNIIPILGQIVFFLVMIGLFVLWIIGLIGAVNGQYKLVPILGASYQKWFGNAFD
jgi:uncharacterized membrane protein